MGKHVIAGAGQVGKHLAGHLLAQGHQVVVITRSGKGPAGVESVAADLTDRDRLTRIVKALSCPGGAVRAGPHNAPSGP